MAASPTWTAPADWANGELVTDTKLNAQVRDNLQTLYQKGPQQGTAFPGSPAAQDRFFRTDLLLDCVYDGTRWLSQNEYLATMIPEALLPYTTSIYVARGALRGDISVYLTKFRAPTLVVAPNNGSNYWTVKVLDASGAVTLAQISTAATTAGVWTAGNVTVNTVDADIMFNVTVTKTGAPGALYAPVGLYYRLILT